MQKMQKHPFFIIYFVASKSARRVFKLWVSTQTFATGLSLGRGLSVTPTPTHQIVNKPQGNHLFTSLSKINPTLQ